MCVPRVPWLKDVCSACSVVERCLFLEFAGQFIEGLVDEHRRSCHSICTAPFSFATAASRASRCCDWSEVQFARCGLNPEQVIGTLFGSQLYPWIARRQGCRDGLAGRIDRPNRQLIGSLIQRYLDVGIASPVLDPVMPNRLLIGLDRECDSFAK